MSLYMGSASKVKRVFGTLNATIFNCIFSKQFNPAHPHAGSTELFADIPADVIHSH